MSLLTVTDNIHSNITEELKKQKNQTFSYTEITDQYFKNMTLINQQTLLPISFTISIALIDLKNF